MKKKYLLFVLILLSFVLIIPSTVFATGWEQQGVNRYYYDNETDVHKGWLNYDNHIYYLDEEDGMMTTGYQYTPVRDSSNPNGPGNPDIYRWYYFSETESPIGSVQTGPQKIGDDWHYFSTLDYSIGQEIRIWIHENDKFYYADNDTGILKLGLQNVPRRNSGTMNDYEWYYFSEDESTIGELQFGWVKIGNYWYYFDPTYNSGAMWTGWLQEDTTRYYLGSDGKMYTGLHYLPRITTDIIGQKSYYYFENNGKMATGWKKIGDYHYYFYPEGHMDERGNGDSGSAAIGWEQIDNEWYYFDNSGKMKTGLLNDEGNIYYLSEIPGSKLGSMITGWMQNGEDWYYFTSNGSAKKGWYNDSNNNWYYFDNNGVMQKGLTEVDGELYYLLDLPYDDGSNNIVATITSQTDLDNYLSITGNNILGDRVVFKNTNSIQFPEDGVFYLDYSKQNIASYETYWYFYPSSTGNVDFNGSTFLIGENTTLFLDASGNHSNQTISNGTFYGSVSNTIKSDGSVSSIKGNFNADLIHVSNMNFNNLNFYNCQDSGDHIFDVMGSDHITFDGITINGFFGNVSINDIDNAFGLENTNWTDHYIYSEAIQIDASNVGASGLNDLSINPGSYDNSTVDTIFNNSLADGLSSTYITITNCNFGPYNGVTGQSIIDKTNNTVVRSYGATIGSHSPDNIGNSEYSNITITHNTFTNTICRSNIGAYRNVYPIHIQFKKAGSQTPTSTLSTLNADYNNFVNLCSSANYSNQYDDTDTVMGLYGTNTNDTTTTNANANSTVDNATNVKANIDREIFTNGIMQIGWQTIDGELYYFRNSKDEISSGSKGAAIVNECVQIESDDYCFNQSGTLSTMVEIPTTDMCSNPVYNGQEQSITKPAPEGYTWSNNICYYCNLYAVATLNEGYVWNDGTTTPKEIKCSIQKAVVDKPTLSNPDIVITGSTQYPEFVGYDANTMEMLGITGATAIGEYETTIKPKGGAEWTDGSSTPIVYVWRIVKHECELPVVVDYNGLYDGEPHTFEVSHPYDDPREHIQFFVEMEYSYDQDTWFDEKPTRTEIGTTTVYVRAKEGETYNTSAPVEAHIVITGNEVEIPTTDMCSNPVYNGEEQSITKPAPSGYTWSNNICVSCSYYAEATLNEGYIWSDGTTSPKEIKCSTQKAKVAKPVLVDDEFAFDGQTKAPTFTGYNSTYMGLTGTTSATSVGEYQITIEPSISSTWLDDSSTPEVYTWKIIKANRTALPEVENYSGLYDGNPHTFTVTYPYDGYEFEYKVGDGEWTTTQPTRTEIGTTTVLVRTKENSQFNASDSVTATITITGTEVEIPTTDMCSNPVYNGQEQSITKPAPVGYTWNNNLKTESGSYTVTALLSTGYEWSDGTTIGEKYINCSMARAQVAKPVLDDSLVSNGSPQQPLFTGFDDTKMTVIAGITSATSVGEYSITIEPKINYEWTDGSRTPEVYVWHIDKGKFTIPTVVDYSGTYDGNPHTFEVSHEYDDPREHIQYFVEMEYSYNQNTWFDEKPTRTEVGTTTVYVRAKEDETMYASEPVEAHITITATTVEIPTNELCNNLVYNGTAQNLLSNVIEGITWSGDSNIQIHAGTYTLTASLETGYRWADGTTSSKDITCSISKARVTKPTINSNSFGYTGELITPTFNNFDETIMDKSGETTSTSVGQYTINISLIYTNNYEWSDGSTNALTYVWSIGKARKTAPTVIDYSGLYDTLEHTFTVTNYDGELEYSFEEEDWFDGRPTRSTIGTTNVYVRVKGDDNYDPSDSVPATIIILEDPYVASKPTNNLCNYLVYNGTEQYLIPNVTYEGIEWSPSIAQTESGTYNLTATLTGDYKWNDYTRDDVIITCSILKVEVAKPTINSNSYTYTGELITPSFNNFDATIMTKTGETASTNAGNYNIKINLRDTNNYIWGTGDTLEQSYDWSITKAYRQAPIVKSYSGIYDGESHTFDVISYTGTLEYSLDQNTWTSEKPTRTDISTTTVYVRSKEETNYNASSIVSATIEIKEDPYTYINVPTNELCNNLTYTGEEQILANTSVGYTLNNNVGTNAGEYNLTATLSNGYKWTDNTITDKYITCSISKAKVTEPTLVNSSYTYTGELITPTFNNYNSSIMTLNGDINATNAGEYSITISLNDTDNYEWNNGLITNIINVWNINKASLDAPVVENYSGTYDSVAHTITVEPVLLGTLNYSTNNSTWSTVLPTRTDPGTTRVYVKVVGDSNHNDSSTVSATITIIDNSIDDYTIDNYPVDDTNNYIDRVSINTTLEVFVSNITLGSEYSVIVDTKTIDNNQLIFTGGKTRIYRGSTLVAEYTNIVTGDTNGDAEIDSGDLLRVRQHLLGTSPLTGPYLIASNVNIDDIVDSGDLLRIRQHLLGIIPIE